MLTFPEITPYIFQVNLPVIGKFGPTWYGLMYVVSFILAYQWAKHKAKTLRTLTQDQVSDLMLTYGVIGVVVGGRIGYVFFYNFDKFLQNPLYLFKITEGGMSFHGGLLGVIGAVLIFSIVHKKNWLEVCDFIAPIAPIGLFFGRIGNFINAELWGKVTDLPWAMVFPNGGPLPRHPSMLYEALLEGLALFIIINLLALKPKGRGFLSGIFLIGYAISRFAVEFVRIPDSHIGYLSFAGMDWITRGQVLCIPMIIAGILFIIFSNKQSKGN